MGAARLLCRIHVTTGVSLLSLVPRLSLLPRNNSLFLRAGQRSNVELLRGRRESLGTRLSLLRVLESISRFIEHASGQWESARGERCRVQAGVTTQQKRAYLSVCALFSELCVPQPKKQNEDQEYDLLYRLRAC